MIDMASPRFQTAIIQSDRHHDADSATTLPLCVSDRVEIPALASDHDVLVRVLAVALNHCDYKMPGNFLTPGGLAGCDFCGIVVKTGTRSVCERGTRVCGGLFPYGRYDGASKPQGAFAEFVAVDSRRLLRIPDTWSDLQGAALGAVGWGTVGLALSDPQALALEGFPSTPTSALATTAAAAPAVPAAPVLTPTAAAAAAAAGPEPVLVYGAATATGTMACQLLKL